MSGTKKGAKKRRFPPAFCLICGYSWEPRSENPKQCPKCQSRQWNKPSEEPVEAPAEQPGDILLATDDALYEVEPAETEDALGISGIAVEPPPEIEKPEEPIVEDAEEIVEPVPPVEEVHIIEIEDVPPEQVDEVKVEPVASPEPLPPIPRLDPRSEMERIEGQERRGRLIAAMRRMRERPRDAERKRTMISQDNPPLYELAATILPKLPIISLLLVLAFSAVTSMAAGNMWFVLDWYQATWVLPQLVGIFTYAGGPSEWFAANWPLVMIAVMLLVSVLIFVWALPWRVAFKDYVIVRGNTKARDGRVMWSTMNTWTRLWDRVYGTEPRTQVDIWLKTKLIWNPLLPSRGLLHLTLDAEAEHPEYDGPFVVTAEERRYRRYVGYNHMVTTDDAQQTLPIPLEEITSNFQSRGRLLVDDTQKFSLANPTVRLEKLRGGTHIVPSDLREAADVARAKRGE